MNVAALVISILSAGVALATLILTHRWREEAHHAAIVAFYMMVKKRQAYRVTDIELWSASGVHESVRAARDDLVSALPGLPSPALEIGERMINACLDYLIALRPYFDEGSDEMTDEAVRQHRAWVDAMNTGIKALRVGRG